MVNNNEWQSFGDLFEDYISDNNTGAVLAEVMRRLQKAGALPGKE